jgi:hypothetical protein
MGKFTENAMLHFEYFKKKTVSFNIPKYALRKMKMTAK